MNWIRAKRGVEAAGERPDGERLGEAGDPFEEEVAVRQKADDEPLDQRVLADDHLPDLGEEGADEERPVADLLGEGGGVDRSGSGGNVGIGRHDVLFVGRAEAGVSSAAAERRG